MEKHPIQIAKHLNSLDALRGLAAITVIFSHWQHFFYVGCGLSTSFRANEQPLYAFFLLFYNDGSRAVDLFFLLSGFVFFWIYKKPIAADKISAGRFFILRFSRLYPLYIVTLLFVAGMQVIYKHIHGEFFVYPANDTYHFGLNLILMSSIGFEHGYSFNSPSWSVSVEALLYFIFYIYCRYFKPNAISLTLISVFGIVVLVRLYVPVGRGVGLFFLGGLVFLIYLRILALRAMKFIAISLIAMAAIAWIGTFYVAYNRIIPINYPLIKKLSLLFPNLILFPLTVISLALFETIWGSFSGPIPRFLGNISYSSYLWHFPLQLIVVLFFNYMGFDNNIFKSSLILFLFFSMLLVISTISYRWFEMPAQRLLRRRSAFVR